MHPLNDNDLDRLSRKAADEFDVEMNASGWEALENRLNKELPPPAEKGKRRFLFWLFLIVLMAGSGLLWSMMHGVDKRLQLTGGEGSKGGAREMGNSRTENSTTTAQEVNTQEANKQAKDNQHTPITEPEADGQGNDQQKGGSTTTPAITPAVTPATVPVTRSSPAPALTPATTVATTPAITPVKEPASRSKRRKGIDDLPKDIGQVNKTQEGRLLADKRNISPRATRTRKQQTANASLTGRSKLPKGDKDNIGIVNTRLHKDVQLPDGAHRSTDGSDGVVQNSNKVVADDPANDDKPAIANSNDAQPPLPDAVLDSLGRQIIAGSHKSTLQKHTDSSLPQTPTADVTTPKKEVQQAAKGKRGFEVGLVAGPDMSNVRFTHTDNSGYNVGVQIGYRFSDKWSVNTGLIYTRKNYTADGQDFVKTGYWSNPNVKLLTVDGYCTMFDIPVNVRYDLSSNDRHRWFGSLGLSSYIMTGEKYDYDYMYGSMRNNRQADYTADSKYLFSILNLSAGYERQLGKRLGVQAEPYFKLPLKGLGHGKLNINSYGIYFSVKYRFGK